MEIPAVRIHPQRPQAERRLAEVRRSAPAAAAPAAASAPPVQPVRDAFAVAAQFIVDINTHHVLVRIYDSQTGETIRTIPPYEIADLVLGAMGQGGGPGLDRLV